VSLAFIPYGSGENGYGANPYGIEKLEVPLTVLAIVSGATVTLCAIASVYSLFWRRKRAPAVERAQLRWFAYAAALMPVAFATPEMIFGDTSEWWIDPTVSAFLLPPIAMSVAIVRHRLFDIDVIINRTLVYGALTAVLVAAYLGLVFALQAVLEPITEESDLAVAASTLAVAALFRPLRSRVQSFIDRRFYRRKYDAGRTLETFGKRLRDEVDLDIVATDVVEVVKGTIQPAHVSLWVRTDQP
jgi:N-terminal 7TM region of histidine kinase